jgi:transposase
MKNKKLFELALHIESPWYIKEINFKEEEKTLDICIDFKKGSTFFYEDIAKEIKGDFKAYDTTNKKWRHLNFFQYECYIHARVPRIKLDNNSVKLIKTPWEGKSKGFTLLFEALVLQLVSNMTVFKVSKLINVSDDKLWRLMEKYVDISLLERDLENVKAIGLDETSRKKGHNYITLFVDLDKRKTIFITEGKSNKTIIDFKDDLEKHNGDIRKIKDVSCDMSPAFIKGVKENMPNAEITFDKFHIIKIINKAVDEVRRSEAKLESILKNSRYVVLKNRENLTKTQKSKLEELVLSKLNLKTLRAYHIRETFQDIYKAETKEQFLLLLKKWFFWATHSQLSPIKKAAYTIKKHWDGVVRWKESMINNGILEGLNSIIQAAKSKARGYSTTKNFKIIAYLLTGDLDFSTINKYYLPI